MLGAIVGDMVGSVYEWHNIKTTEFPLFSENSRVTDDSVMTIAVAHTLLDAFDGQNVSQSALVRKMQSYGKLYPDAGYGGKFRRWLKSPYPKPYNSYGNGSAMRVSPVAWAASTLEDAERLAAATAEVTHNHPEGMKGAQATAACIMLARLGASNADIRDYVEQKYARGHPPALRLRCLVPRQRATGNRRVPGGYVVRRCHSPGDFHRRR